MKFIIIITTLLITNLSFSKDWNCDTVEATLSLVESSKCTTVKFCMGFATCLNKEKNASISGRIICKANSESTCPNAKDCLKQVSEGGPLSIEVRKVCSGESSLVLLKNDGEEVVSSRFCEKELVNCTGAEISPKCTQLKESCDNQKKDGFTFKWDAEKAECTESAIKQEDPAIAAKALCDEKRKDGFTFKWDAEKAECTELVKSDGEKDCEEKNAKWIAEENDGFRSSKYSWDGSTCKDMKAAKNSREKVKKEEEVDTLEEPDEPSLPKSAPVRFKPINIPGRQMYLMPGMI